MWRYLIEARVDKAVDLEDGLGTRSSFQKLSTEPFCTILALGIPGHRGSIPRQAARVALRLDWQKDLSTKQTSLHPPDMNRSGYKL